MAHPYPHTPSPTLAEVADVVSSASIHDLAAILAGWDPRWGITREPAFRCLSCGAGETATVRSSSRWGCSACRYQGTVFGLRRVVIEDADACDRLLLLLATPVEYVAAPALADPWELAR